MLPPCSYAGVRSSGRHFRWHPAYALAPCASPDGDTRSDNADPQVRSAKLARLEAALFAAEGPLHARRLAQVAVLDDGTEARMLMRRLNELYDQSGSAFRVEQVAGGFRLLTRPQFRHWLAHRHQRPHDLQLSGAALETLTIVAYRQPVLRAQVEAIRGVQCGEMLRQLLEKGVIRIVGRDSTLGRPILYGTTRTFLEVFGLMSLDELPLSERLRRPSAESPLADASSPAPPI